MYWGLKVPFCKTMGSPSMEFSESLFLSGSISTHKILGQRMMYGGR